jgi:hypothetical protein
VTLALPIYGEPGSATGFEPAPPRGATAVAEPPGLTQLMGRTGTDHIVVFDGPTDLRGRFVRVRIERATAYTLFGVRS